MNESEFKESYYESSKEIKRDSFDFNLFITPPSNDCKLISFKPLVVMIGIDKYNNFQNRKCILNDYINVERMLNIAKNIILFIKLTIAKLCIKQIKVVIVLMLIKNKRLNGLVKK